jgi:ubiquitin-protein ligase
MEISPYASEIRKIIDTNNNSENIIELLDFEETEEFFILQLSVNSTPIKLTTNFKNYCYFESNIIIVEDLNNYFFENKVNDVFYVMNKLFKFVFDYKVKENVQIVDRYHIYQEIEETTKVIINYELVEKESKLQRDTKSTIDISKFPKELLFNSNQIYQLLINEIKSFNKNLSFKHYLEPIENNPYNLKLITYLNSKNKDLMVEMKINVDPKIYPFFPPKIEFIKPAIKLPLVYSLMNLKILKMENWNPTISLQWLIEKLVEQLEPIIHDYIKEDSNKFTELNFLLVKLASITKEYSSETDLINISVPKVSFDGKLSNGSANKYWKSGVGYGHDNRDAWDISAFIKQQEVQNYEISLLIKEITNNISSDCLDELFSSTLGSFITNRIGGLTLLELEKNESIYKELLVMLDKLINNSNFKLKIKLINDIANSFNVISDEINSLFQSMPETQDNNLYLQIHCLADWFKTHSDNKFEANQDSDKPEDISNSENSEDYSSKIDQLKYEEIMKKLQFTTYEIPSNHRFKEFLSDKPEASATKRMISEISTFKNGLPLNWESTVWVRASKKCMNVFSFFISGPKNTPYENGIFEFHATFPKNYPNSEPKVLLNTTGGGKVRFNPNLYHCGKVCLSLLGTWSGQEGEKWNPKNSTFLQVLVSIQSLIFIETPYFNEPGWEREMNTPAGALKSKDYNEPLQIGTIEWAINDMISNPPNGMEEVIKHHFSMKKEEIIKTTGKWLAEVSNKNKIRLEEVRNKMISLFEKFNN